MKIARKIYQLRAAKWWECPIAMSDLDSIRIFITQSLPRIFYEKPRSSL